MKKLSRQVEDVAVRRIRRRMQSIKASNVVIETFLRHYRRMIEGDTGMIGEAAIEPATRLPDSRKFGSYAAAGRAALGHAVIIKLNGGLGTSMGLDKTKSLLRVKEGLSFLDIIIRQILFIRKTYRCSTPLLLMNSFNTSDDTLKALARYPELARTQPGKIPLAFLQHQVPKIWQDDFMPVEWPMDRSREWCPPGHGDLYTALVNTGLLDLLLDQEFHYAFVANADNLGATPDPGILGFFATRRLPFMMEVTERTETDKKGGHLAVFRNGRFLLRERAQCPAHELTAFEDIAHHRYFNTNNIWIDLRRLKKMLGQCDNVLDLSLIINRKPVDPADPDSPAVYQLETAMGSAISLFPDAQALRVPRSRFAPVKTTDDLLAVRSDAYVLTREKFLITNPKRTANPPVVHLDPAFYRTLADFESRFPKGPPSLLHCKSLTIHGDIRFGRDLRLKGRVDLRNDTTRQIAIRDRLTVTGQKSPA